MSVKGTAVPNGSASSLTTHDRHTRAGLSREQLLGIYRTMLSSRKLDDKEIQLKNQSAAFFQISAAGHEAVQIAAGMALRPAHDWAYLYYRDRAFCLTWGVTVESMLLASVGAADDPHSGGRQMPSHWSDPRLRIVSPSSTTSTQCLHGVGCAEAGRLWTSLTPVDDRTSMADDIEVVLITLGDGSTSEGEFWESMSTACNRRLPVIYLVEDNGYAISVPVEVQTPGGSISRLLDSFPGLRIIRADGTDFFDSYGAMRNAVSYVRAGSGPALVHATVIRLYSHSLSDDEKLYKSRAERAAEAERDPLLRFTQYCTQASIATDADLAAVSAELDQEIAAVTERVLQAPKPTPDTATRYVYSPDVDPTSTDFDVQPAPSGRADTMVAAINRTLKDEMARNPRIVVFGQDVADCSREETLSSVPGKGGVFKVTHGLQRAYGAERVFNTPLAEANIIGRAVGMAIRGLKPVAEIQFFDYIWPAMTQLRNEVSMLRYRSNNAFSCPMVVRVPIGGYLRGGALYHSQSGESFFAHCPGLRIAYPSNAIDASGLLRTAIRCDDPVLFLEHKHLYRQTYNKGEYPGPDYTVPFGKASVRREGNDVVIVTWGALVQRSLLAAQQAAKADVSVMVIDLRTIAPYDWATIAAATQRTNRVVVAHEDQLTCGFGAEIVARIADELFDYLDAPIKRVAALDCPVAYSPILEEETLPQGTDILRAIQDVVQY